MKTRPMTATSARQSQGSSGKSPSGRNTNIVRSNEKKIITFSWARVGDQTDEVSIRAEAERVVARSMCLPVVINGAQAGPALIDQGATRSVMRWSAYKRIKGHMLNRAPLKKVNNTYVVGSTNELVPVIGIFVC